MTIASDFKTEGPEKLTLEVNDATYSVIINDTSKKIDSDSVIYFNGNGIEKNFFAEFSGCISEEIKSLDKDKATYEITRLISKRIEEWITDKPEQWLWAHRRWGK